MELVMKYGLIHQSIMEIIMTEKNMAQVLIYGQIKLDMKENGKIMSEKDLEFIILKMVMYIKANLEII